MNAFVAVEYTISMGHRLPSYKGICSSKRSAKIVQNVFDPEKFVIRRHTRTLHGFEYIEWHVHTPCGENGRYGILTASFEEAIAIMNVWIRRRKAGEPECALFERICSYYTVSKKEFLSREGH